jgi:tRNA uridine 5-carboxymethylaminomethyl modification enzyme
MEHDFDILVIGGGHAGAEAAAAAARLGARVGLITMDSAAIGRMSCNPAIGGLGKGQIVREIDALGGIMGLAIDRAGIQFRMLNRRKGPAVWAPRAQADRDLYAGAVQNLLRECPNLEILEGLVDEILVEESPNHRPDESGESKTTPVRVKGVLLADGRKISASAVIVTTGTFLRALMHCGKSQSEGGRVGEAASKGLSAQLTKLGFELGRLKTGTPPRVHRDSLNFDQLEPQYGDEAPVPFSFMTDRIEQQQVQCWITYTNETVHELIRANLHQAPMYSGQIESQGPRYCPSIEDKVVRFADKSRHQLFLEPEGYENERIYCNGISTSLPADVQAQIIRQIPGMQAAEIIQPGYAVEYDWVPTHQIKRNLETKRVKGLFLAGQINGTSGYEEAAGQGLIAGINAARFLKELAPFVSGRDQSYIGVMIDDLIVKPPKEPYRMFTSRAEYRLHLRGDNADLRLTPIGRDIGLVDDERWTRFEHKRDAISEISTLTAGIRHNGILLDDWLRRPTANADELSGILSNHLVGPINREAIEQAFIAGRYSGYLARQDRQVAQFRKAETMHIPERIDFSGIKELRIEAREKFTKISPRTLGQASRIEGISPADISVLWTHIAGRKKPSFS